MRNRLLLISLSLLLAACATDARDGNTGRSHLKSDLRVDGYYESMRVNDFGEQMFLRFYHGSQEDFSGDKRVKVLLTQPGVPDFSGEKVFDTRFTVSSYRTISYQAIHERQQYAAVSNMDEFTFLPDDDSERNRVKAAERRESQPSRSSKDRELRRRPVEVTRPGEVTLENF